MTPQDPKRVVGNRVHARARHVVGDKSARNRYGRLWKDQFVYGTVKGIVTARVNVREQASVDVLWDIGEGTKRMTVRVINIRTRDAHGQNEPSLVKNGDQQANETAVVAEEDEVDLQDGESTVSRPPRQKSSPRPSLEFQSTSTATSGNGRTFKLLSVAP
jgi:hypothetical protein